MTNTGTAAPITLTNTTLAEIKMRGRFETLIMSVTDESYSSEMTGDVAVFYARVMTFEGSRVGANTGRSFKTEAAARDFANGWFAELAGKGYKRTA